MIPTLALWLPILLSTVAVFVVSSVIHMLLGYHNSDFGRVPAEDDVMDGLRGFELPPGDYMLPCAANNKEKNDPAFMEKMKTGPVVMMTVWETGSLNIGSNLLQWFLYCLLISFFTAYLTGLAVDAGAAFMVVLRFAGTAAFGAYSMAMIQDSIWYKRKWSTTLKNVFDGFVYAAVTAAVFALLWPVA